MSGKTDFFELPIGEYHPRECIEIDVISMRAGHTIENLQKRIKELESEKIELINKYSVLSTKYSDLVDEYLKLKYSENIDV
ncbi:hypothetical protein [Sulfuricurvum sp.]|uniref:hypothetical protein n=1 Tax=Sulfuricurvum sp. TaxID=2025608 RepID=UPI00261CF8C9|nr:hypothetical protein [Sulfuricurvum sp.]MDD2267664.1 hypothetical protein [Sulfuricurvum sp.]MDD2784247.1 hypothetical protein [Sulfuricurvum sp.]